ncbi:DUF1573 domain-containing protein [Candidatus Woesebacteria bacterium]|nr:DUF1573 domain-containing protein [Candidatus Woesebacteria bacterium]
MNTKIIVAGIVAIVIILTGSYLLIGTVDTNSHIERSINAKATIDQTDYDWGVIGIHDGIVQATFPIKNGGTEPLKLFNVQTSCMCTTAQLKVEDVVSPEFGMHTKSSYVTEVPPGKTAQLVVTFDPAFHGPSGIGPITRQIMVETNDKANPRLAFTAEANVVSQGQ